MQVDSISINKCFLFISISNSTSSLSCNCSIVWCTPLDYFSINLYLIYVCLYIFIFCLVYKQRAYFMNPQNPSPLSSGTIYVISLLFLAIINNVLINIFIYIQHLQVQGGIQDKNQETSETRMADKNSKSPFKFHQLSVIHTSVYTHQQ